MKNSDSYLFLDIWQGQSQQAAKKRKRGEMFFHYAFIGGP